jgi:hypothetical protein
MKHGHLSLRNVKFLVLALALVSLPGLAEEQSAGRRGGPPIGGDPQAFVSQIAERYRQLAQYDVDRNGELDDMEQSMILRAIADGNLKPLTFNGGPGLLKPTTEILRMRMSAMFPRLAAFDVNRDGVLDSTEQEAVRSVIAQFRADARP